MSANGASSLRFEEFLTPNKRPYTLGPTEDANLVGMRLYGHGPFHRELKLASKIRKKSHFVIRRNDVIYNKLFAWKGTFGIVPKSLDGMFVSDKFPTYELDEKQVDRDFLRWYFRYPPLWEQARQMSVGSAALSKLTLNPPSFMQLTIPRIPVPEQRRIVAKIERLISKTDEAYESRTESIASMENVVGGAIRDILGRCQNAASDRTALGDFVAAYCYGTSEKTMDEPMGIPILRMGNIQNGRLDVRDLKYLQIADKDRDKWVLRKGDIVVNRTNSAELVGKCAVFELDGDWGFASYLIRIRLDTTRAEPRLVARYINSPMGRDYMFRERTQMTGQANVNSRKLRSLPLCLPPLAEQRRILAYLDRLQAKVDELKRLQAETAAELDALLPAILDRAFKGQL